MSSARDTSTRTASTVDALACTAAAAVSSAAVSHDDFHSLGGEPFCEREPDPARRARHDRHPVSEPLHGAVSYQPGTASVRSPKTDARSTAATVGDRLEA